MEGGLVLQLLEHPSLQKKVEYSLVLEPSVFLKQKSGEVGFVFYCIRLCDLELKQQWKQKQPVVL